MKQIDRLKRDLVGRKFHGYVIQDVALVKGKPVVYFYDDEGNFVWNFYNKTEVSPDRSRHMANYKYKIYNKRGKLVAEATTKREAEKEAKRLGGHYIDQSGLYQLKNPHCPTEQHSNPHCYKNPEDDPDFQRGFADGLMAVSMAVSYYGKRSNPAPEAPSQASTAYQAGFVSAVQMFGIHLISQSDISRAVIEELAGGKLSLPSAPRKPRKPRKPRRQKLSDEPDVSDLAAKVLNVIPPEATSPATKVKRGMIIGAVSAIDAEAGEQLKKGAVWSATIKELMAAGVLAQDGTKRGAGYYLTGKQVGVIAEPKKPKKPRKGRKKAEPKPKPEEAAPAFVVNQEVLSQAIAAASAKRVRKDEIDTVVDTINNTIDTMPVIILMKVQGAEKLIVLPRGDRSVEEIAEVSARVDDEARVFDPVLKANPYFGRGRGRFWGSWG